MFWTAEYCVVKCIVCVSGNSRIYSIYIGVCVLYLWVCDHRLPGAVNLDHLSVIRTVHTSLEWALRMCTFQVYILQQPPIKQLDKLPMANLSTLQT